MKAPTHSLDGLVAGIGTLVVLALFVPVGGYLLLDASRSAERLLAQRAETLADFLAGQVVDVMLVEDHLALHEMLERVLAEDGEVRYLAVVDEKGEPVVHTFGENGLPAGLAALWRDRPGRMVRFRSREGPLLDVWAPVLEGSLGRLHVGFSRARAAATVRRMTWTVVAALGIALTTVFAGAHFIALRMSLPLKRLEQAVRGFPDETGEMGKEPPRGTREVVTLWRCFAEMARRVKTLEAERAATQRRMIEAERLAALGEVAAGLAHEIHNPLDGMQECLRFLESDPQKSDRAAKYYPMLSEGLERIARVMREMLTFARSGERVVLEPCRAARMVDSLVPLVEGHLSGRDVRLDWRQVGPCACLCDRQGLAQAFLNLVLNAAEAAEGSADPTVRISADCDRQWVYIAVEDSGPGVPAEIRERIFEPFFTTKPVGRGTGLGLSVSRQLIRAAGGEVELAPEPGSLGGARFVIRLPKAGEEACSG